jgi:hypothetical protein
MEVEAGASVPNQHLTCDGGLSQIAVVGGDWRLENGSRGWSEGAQPTPD